MVSVKYLQRFVQVVSPLWFWQGVESSMGRRRNMREGARMEPIDDLSRQAFAEVPGYLNLESPSIFRDSQ